jgi:hypothetical protein
MKAVLKIVSFAGLALTVVPGFLVLSGDLTWSSHAALMGVGTILWFVTAPFWMHKEPPPRSLWRRRRPV